MTHSSRPFRKLTVALTVCIAVALIDWGAAAASEASPRTPAGPTTAPAIDLSPAVLPVATGAVPYDQQLSATGGDGGPFTFALDNTAKRLPPGLSLSPTGDLSGTPTRAGTFRFTVVATDPDSDTGSAAYAIAVRPGLNVFGIGIAGETFPVAAGPLSSGSLSVLPFGVGLPSSVRVSGQMTDSNGSPMRISLSASRVGLTGCLGWLTLTDPIGTSPLYSTPIYCPSNGFKRVGLASVVGAGLMFLPEGSTFAPVPVAYEVVANT